MKIALALEKFDRHSGGAEAYAVELARTLVSEGWEVHLYGHSWAGEPAQAVFHPIPRLPRWVPPSVRILDFAFRHRSMVRGQDFDVVLGFGNTLEMNVYQSHGGVHYLSNSRKLRAVRNPALRFLKTLALFASPKYHARAWIEAAPFRAKEPPVIVAISDMVRNDMADYFRVPGERIRLVYNGVDVRKFEVAAAGAAGKQLRTRLGFDDEVLFLFMAYDFRKKGVRFLLQAADRLRRKVRSGRFGIVVVGGPPSRSLARLVSDLQLTDVVRYPGPTREPEAYYSACDVFILPTFYDACSLVVIEAMAAGLPAITTQYNGAAGIVTDSVDGKVLSDPANIDDMACAMWHFLDREVLRTASVVAERTASQYTLEANHRRMLSIFNELVDSRRTPEMPA